MPLSKDKKRKLRKILAAVSPDNKNEILFSNLEDDLKDLHEKLFNITNSDNKEIRSELNLIKKEILQKIENLPTLEGIKKNQLIYVTEFETKLKTLSKEIETEIDNLKKKNSNQDFQKEFDKWKIEILSKLSRGGSMNRQIKIGGIDYLTKYTDINLVAGTNITISVANDDTNKRVNITLNGASETDPLAIHKDGSSVTSQSIPFAQGLTVGDDTTGAYLTAYAGGGSGAFMQWANDTQTLSTPALNAGDGNLQVNASGLLADWIVGTDKNIKLKTIYLYSSDVMTGSIFAHRNGLSGYQPLTYSPIISADLLLGSDTQVIFRDGTNGLVGDAGLTYNKTTDALTAGSVNANSAGSTSTFSGTLDAAGELKGSRMILTFNRTTILADAYLGSAAVAFDSTTGYTMPRAGSIVGIGANAKVTIETSAGTIDFQVRKNDTSVFLTTITTSGVATYNSTATQARGTDTFAAGDVLVGYVDFNTFAGTVAPVSMVVEVQFDS